MLPAGVDAARGAFVVSGAYHHSMPEGGIPIGQWSGSDATHRLREVITEYSETAERQTRTMIRLTKVIVALKIVLVIGLVIQIVALLTG
jgi:hypothetical protein